MMPASNSITTLPSATFHTSAVVPLPDTEQPAVVMEPFNEGFPMPIITEVVSLANCASVEGANRFDFAETPVPSSSSDDKMCSEPQAKDTFATFSVAEDIKPFDLQYTSNNSGTSLDHRTETPARLPNVVVKIESTQHANEEAAGSSVAEVSLKTPTRLPNVVVKSESTQHANEEAAGSSVAEVSLPSCLPNTSDSSASVPRGRCGSQQTNVKSGDGLRVDKNAVGTAVIKGFVPRVLKNSNDRKYERRPPGNNTASMPPQYILVPVPVSRMPAPLNAPQACISQLPASARLVPNESLVNYSMRPPGHSNPALVVFSPVSGTMAPNIQLGQSSLQPRVPSQAPLITRGIQPSVPPQVPLVTVPQSVRQPNAPAQAPLITRGLIQSTPPEVPLVTASSTASQSAQRPSAPVRASLIIREIRPSGTPRVPVVTAPCTAMVPYHNSMHQTIPVPHRSAQSTGPDKPHLSQALGESHMKQPGAILGSAAMADASSQTSNQQPNETVEKSRQAKGPLENNALSTVNKHDNRRKSQLSSVAGHSKEAASQSTRTPKMYPTQVWQRSKSSASSEAVKQSQNDRAAQGDKRSSVLSSPWERIIVSSDIVSTLTLDAVRKGIESFLMVSGVPEKVSRGGAIHLHWNGKDLSSFRFKHGASGGSMPAQHTTTEETIVISSDDEQAEEAPKTTTHDRPVTSCDERSEKTRKIITRRRRVAAAASVESACIDPEQLLEPEIVLEESDSLLPLKPLERSLSDSEDSSDTEKASENSNDDPTYDPYEELDDISSGDELLDSSSDESDDATAKSKNHNGLSGKNSEQVQENPKGIPDAGESSLTQPCANSSSKVTKRKCSGSSTEDELEPNLDNSAAEQLERKNYDSQLSCMRRSSRKVRRRSSRPLTRLETAKAVPPLQVLIPPCQVELSPIDMTLVVNGSVNLSVVREEELFVTYHSAGSSSELIWARLANAISQAHGLVSDW